jgi:IclR family transcriptional regulator, KDG regulon repressor
MAGSEAGSGKASRQRAEEIPREAPTRTLEKGLSLLGLFDVDHPEWTLRELREQAGLPKATTRRLMKTLEASNWVAYDSEAGTYHLGSAVLRALYLATSHNELVRIGHPFLVQLEEETNETSCLTVWTEQGALIIDTVPTTRPFKPRTWVGMLLWGTGSADAQVLVAFGSEHTRRSMLAALQKARTEKTVVDPEALAERLAHVRRDGVVVEQEEWLEGAAGVAAPVFDQNGQLRAAVSLVPPIERFSDAEVRDYVAAVKRTAASLSAELGYRGR